MHKMVLVETDNTTVVSYINREGGMRSGPLCALLWRILTWCARNQVPLKARHRLADCDRSQAIQARPDHPNRVVSPSGGLPSNMQQVAPASTRLICHEVQQQVALVCVTGTGSPGYSSECAQFAMVGSGSIHLPTVSHIGQAVMLQDSPYKRIILIAPGWPIMPWFWDPVAMSSQIPLSLPNLPNLLTQPFNQIPHRNLTNLNLDARLLEPQYSRSRASLRRWQKELRLLKRGSTRSVYEASGPLLQVVRH